MKRRRILSIILVLCSLFFTVQSAFASGTPRLDPIQWTVNDADSSCYTSQYSSVLNDYSGVTYMSGGLNSNSSCYGAVYGTTYVSNASKLSIDVLYSHWGRGNYWHYAAVCTANGQCVTSNDDYWGGLGEIDVSGYSGTVSFILELSSDGIGFGGAELGLQNLTAQ